MIPIHSPAHRGPWPGAGAQAEATPECREERVSLDAHGSDSPVQPSAAAASSPLLSPWGRVLGLSHRRVRGCEMPLTRDNGAGGDGVR